MELRHIRYFVAVAEELNFSRAATRLNISQPPLSQQIAALEAELGAKLLVRNSRGVELTAAGRTFLKRAREILSLTQEAVEETQWADRGSAGTLSVGYMSSVMLLKLGAYLKRFCSDVPSADLILERMPSDQQYMAVLRGELDVGFVDLALDHAEITDADRLDVRPTLEEHLLLCVSCDHPLAERSQIAARDLEGLPFVALSRHGYSASYERLCQICDVAGFQPFIRQQVASMPIAIAMAAAGYAVALVPDLRGTLADQGAIRLIPLEEDPRITVFMISRRDDQMPLVERMREICTIGPQVV
ncbi:LysR family transcriptional regulator (plasmid) [Sphingopyxis indica]|uniref:LysR family transcriptional regulator n=1 Tax=Sphingopyxis indica TaxID=436663 RepID=UPI002938F544|nr:LysR substrate-binding domain-containing protein [Sphingopyxis indica]WOF45888.1 LysR family transcriptional regulator [Sphingopyxis indica]